MLKLQNYANDKLMKTVHKPKDITREWFGMILIRVYFDEENIHKTLILFL